MIDTKDNKDNKDNVSNTGTGSSYKPDSGNASNTELKKKVGDAVTGDKEAAKEVMSQAKDKAGQAVGRAYEKVSDQAVSKIDEQKSQLAQGLSTVADNLRQVDKNLQNADQATPFVNVTGKYTNSLAGQIEQVADYLDKKDLGDMAHDVQDFARRNPVVFLGGAFAAGILLARFLKSSGSRRDWSAESIGNTRKKVSGQQKVSEQQGVNRT